MLQIKVKAANINFKVANKPVKGAKKLLQVANYEISCKYFFKLANMFPRLTNIFLQVQIFDCQLQKYIS